MTGEVREPVEVVRSGRALLGAPTSEAPLVRVLPLTKEVVVNAAPALDRAVCLSQALERHSLMLAESTYKADTTYAAMLHDVEVIFPSGVVLPEGDRIWSDSTLGAFWLDPTRSQSPGLFSFSGRTGRSGGPSRTLDDLLTINGLERSRGVPLIGFNKSSGNYMHWLTNSVFSAWLFAADLRQGRLQMLVPDLSPLTLASLAAAGVGRQSLLVTPPGRYRFDRAVFPSPLSTVTNRRPPPLLSEMFRAIGASARMTRATRAPPERIYVTRDGAPSMRRMINESELMEALIARGFEIVAPS